MNNHVEDADQEADYQIHEKTALNHNGHSLEFQDIQSVFCEPDQESINHQNKKPGCDEYKGEGKDF